MKTFKTFIEEELAEGLTSMVKCAKLKKAWKKAVEVYQKKRNGTFAKDTSFEEHMKDSAYKAYQECVDKNS